MRRCPHCGAERAALTVCEHCGLSPAEASRAMRRSLVNRLGIFLLGTIAFFVPCFLYPPLDLDGMLIFVGVVFVVTITLAVWAERRSFRGQEVEVMKHVFQSLVLIPWLIAATLLINGSLDNSPPRDIESIVVSRLSVPGLLPMHQLMVPSWRDGHTVERLAVSRQDFEHFRVGDRIIVRVKGGLLFPWLFGVYNP